MSLPVSSPTPGASDPAAQDAAGIASTVASHPFLHGLAPAHLEALGRLATVRQFEPGDLIFKQGDAARHFYLINWGLVALTHAGLKHNVALQTLTAGDALGWSWLFPPYAWHFNAMATEPTRVLCFPGEDLRRLCEEQSEFGRDFMTRIAKVLIDRLQKTRRKLLKLEGDL